MTFSSKLITCSFSLASGQFGSGGNNLTVTGLRVSAHIEVRGGASQSQCQLAIYGLSLSHMNQLTTFGQNFSTYNKNGLTVMAGDASGMTLVFQGLIHTAYIDAQAQPQVCLRVQGGVGNFNAANPQTPISFQGSTPAATVAKKIAGMMGLGFIDNGVKTILSNPYYSSDAMTMIRRLAEHAGFDHQIDKGNLTITPPGGSNQGGAKLVSKDTGMVGYPMLNSQQLTVRTEFGRPVLNWNDSLQIESSITPANGLWTIFTLDHDLESMVPHGKWFSTSNCIIAGNPAPTS